MKALRSTCYLSITSNELTQIILKVLFVQNGSFPANEYYWIIIIDALLCLAGADCLRF